MFQSILISSPFNPLLSISLSIKLVTSQAIDGVGGTLFTLPDWLTSLFALSLQYTVIVFSHNSKSVWGIEVFTSILEVVAV